MTEMGDRRTYEYFFELGFWKLADAVSLTTEIGMVPLFFSREDMESWLDRVHSHKLWELAMTAIIAGKLPAIDEQGVYLVDPSTFCRWRVELTQAGEAPKEILEFVNRENIKERAEANGGHPDGGNEGVVMAKAPEDRRREYTRRNANRARLSLLGAICVVCYGRVKRRRNGMLCASPIAKDVVAKSRAIFPKDGGQNLLKSKQLAELLSGIFTGKNGCEFHLRKHDGDEEVRQEYLLRSVLWVLSRFPSDCLRNEKLNVPHLLSSIQDHYAEIWPTRAYELPSEEPLTELLVGYSQAVEAKRSKLE